MIIDTHCHLDDASFDTDLDAVIERATIAGVRSIIIPGADVADLDKACKISHAWDNVYFAVGVHPYEIDSFDMEVLKRYADDPKCVGVGECGLDYFRLKQQESKETKALEISRQKDAFISQIDLATQLQKPLIVHIREANEDSFGILKDRAGDLCGGVLHCFNASKLLLGLSEYGFYFGIGGGAYAAYRVTDWFAPMVGVQYMHSNYSVFFKDIAERSNSVLVFAGVKLVER